MGRPKSVRLKNIYIISLLSLYESNHSGSRDHTSIVPRSSDHTSIVPRSSDHTSIVPRSSEDSKINESLYNRHLIATSKYILPMGPQLVEKARQIAENLVLLHLQDLMAG